MAKKRIHEIAKERGMSSKDLLDKLQAAGLDVKAAASTVEEADALRAIGGTGKGSGTPARGEGPPPGREAPRRGEGPCAREGPRRPRRPRAPARGPRRTRAPEPASGGPRR